jgi:hypothetical protein
MRGVIQPLERKPRRRISGLCRNLEGFGSFRQCVRNPCWLTRQLVLLCALRMGHIEIDPVSRLLLHARPIRGRFHLIPARRGKGPGNNRTVAFRDFLLFELLCRTQTNRRGIALLRGSANLCRLRRLPRLVSGGKSCRLCLRGRGLKGVGGSSGLRWPGFCCALWFFGKTRNRQGNKKNESDD